MSHACKHPHRQGKHLRAALDALRRLGATSIEVLHTKHLRLAWRYQGVSFAIPLPLSTRAAVTSPVWAIRSQLRRAGFAVPAALCA